MRWRSVSLFLHLLQPCVFFHFFLQLCARLSSLQTSLETVQTTNQGLRELETWLDEVLQLLRNRLHADLVGEDVPEEYEVLKRDFLKNEQFMEDTKLSIKEHRATGNEEAAARLEIPLNALLVRLWILRVACGWEVIEFKTCFCREKLCYRVLCMSCSRFSFAGTIRSGSEHVPAIPTPGRFWFQVPARKAWGGQHRWSYSLFRYHQHRARGYWK